MAYFLKKSVTNKGIYLQIYESYRNKEKKQTAHKAFKSIGYVDDLTSDKIPDPISYYQNFVKKMNEKRMKLKSENDAIKPRLDALLQEQRTLNTYLDRENIQEELSNKRNKQNPER